MTQIIKKIIKLIFSKYETPLRINFYSRFTKNVFLGKNTIFNGLVIKGKGKVIIGDNFWLRDRVTILGGVTIEEGTIYKQVQLLLMMFLIVLL